MTRKEFIKLCGILGVSIPIEVSLSACIKDAMNIDFRGKVIIIGAGAGGLSSGYLLQQIGIDFEILEASSNFGGRMKINTDFADFPVPLGAEWLETGTDIFQEIVNDSAISVYVNTIPDAPDRKFVNYSWYNFFEDYIVPSISTQIRYNTKVQSIDYSDNQLVVKTQNGHYQADKVIISVPLKILQDGDICFIPPLPTYKLDAINDTVIWEGFKAFIEFSSNFYGEGYEFEIEPKSDGEKIYYNAAFGQNTDKNILGLFVVGKPARDFITQSGDEVKDFILNELDRIFSGQASAKYVKHITQNWNNEPFIKSGYMTDDADWKTVKKLGEPVGEKLYFAGGEYTNGDDWVSVHAAAQSAKVAIEKIANTR